MPEIDEPVTASPAQTTQQYRLAESNAEVAALFSELADYLEILGENAFKIRAYRNAVSALETLSEPVVRLAAEDRLGEIPGFGDAIQSKTRDFISVGTTKALEDARRKVPAGAREFIGLPGIGPKAVHQLFTQLHVDSLAALELAVDEHRVLGLPGMGEKTEVKLKEAIERRRRFTKRMLLSEARQLGDSLIEKIRAGGAVDRIEQTGSARRGVETVGDIDIVATSADPARTTAAFLGNPQVAKVLATGDKSTRVLLANGFEADLKLSAPGNFGALLHHFTGSKAHSIHLRAIAETRGLKINEYGVFRSDGENIAVGDDEMAVYAALGLPPIAVELREDRGEIEAALAGRLPSLIDVSHIRGDLHSHTSASDGRASIVELAIAAKRRGYEYLAITDHSQSLTVANGLTPDRLRAQIKQVRAASEETGIRILTGVECDIKADGAMDLPDDLLSELDIVVASVHSRFQQPADEITRRIVRAIENPHVDIIGHPTGRLLNQRDPYAVDMEVVIEAAARTNTALEINSFPERLDMNDLHARMAKNAGVKIVIDTDAHDPAHFALIRYGIIVARRAWLEPGDVLNACGYDELMAWLRGDRS